MPNCVEPSRPPWVGNLAGTISAALGIGVTDQILQPFLGAVLGKITVLTALILFRPRPRLRNWKKDGRPEHPFIRPLPEWKVLKNAL